jgi:Kef-type K+ transport system membrane component KefB
MTPVKRHATFLTGLFVVAILTPVARAAETAHEAGGHSINERMTDFVIRLAMIICMAKIAAFICENYLKIPEVLGELGVGVILGPYALGSVIGLFPSPAETGAFPINAELYAVATFASILLLYLAGLETDLSMLVKYSVAGSLVGIGGVVVSFFIGALSAVWVGLADSFLHPSALFLGAISTATSVGITVRILSQRRKLHSPEGVTILTAAVIDDVLGIIVLAVVIGMARMMSDGGQFDWGRVGLVAGRALGFWIGATALSLLLAKRVGKFLEFFNSRETMATFSLGLALFLAGISEKAGLALIIGAYITGLAFSRVDCADELRRRLEPVYHTLVCVFFCVLGMLVDVTVIPKVFVAGIVFTVFAILTKLLGSGLPSLLVGFNLRGAFRIGIGMLPRGEIALIIAGIGLSTGLVGQEIFGVAVMATLITTFIAPLIMVHVFNDKSGLQKKRREQEGTQESPPIEFELPNKEVAEFMVNTLIDMFEDEECYVHQVATGEPIFQIRKDDIAMMLRREGTTVTLNCRDHDREFGRLMLMEAVANLIRVFEGIQQMQKTGSLGMTF